MSLARPRAHEHFDQVMAQQPLFGKSSGSTRLEGAHIVNPFAVVGTFAGEILVHIGDRPCIRVDSNRVPRKGG